MEEFQNKAQQSPTQLVLHHENHATSPLLFNEKEDFSTECTKTFFHTYYQTEFTFAHPKYQKPEAKGAK